MAKLPAGTTAGLHRPRTDYCPPRKPSRPQEQFITLDCREAAYLGGVGSGKSDALLRAALQYVHIPGYAAIILRRKFKDLILPGAIYDRAIQWLRGKGVHHDRETYTFTFPEGGRLVFGHMQHEADRANYDSSEFQFIGFDEIQHFSLIMYEHMFSRLRSSTDIGVPWRMRVSGMPDSSAIGYGWVKDRFVDPGRQDIPCVQATADDNPGIDVAEYEKSLAGMSGSRRTAFRWNRWDIVADGGKFSREWFDPRLGRIVGISDVPVGARMVRAWDRASTPKTEGRADPDWARGVKMAIKDGAFWIVHVAGIQGTPHEVEKLIAQTAAADGRVVPVVFAQERGDAGKAIVEHFARSVLPGYQVLGYYETGDLAVRADPLSAAAEHGLVKLVSGEWVSGFLDEACAFPDGAHDDQIAAASLAHWYLTGGPQLSTNIMTGHQAGLNTRRVTPSIGQTSGLARSLGKHF